MPIPVGMDLGTTYSAVARLDDAGRPATLFNAEGDRTTPSLVLIDGEDIVVGVEALKAMASEAELVADCAKRDIGRRAFHKQIGGKEYPPEAIEAFILSKLRRDAIDQIGPFTQAVITVPAYFDEVRRKATQDAGYMAGVDVLDIINEPTAAAVCFGYQEGFLSDDGAASDAPRTFLVYDLGGGTFDVTVMEVRGREFVALATDGDVALGGRDWDFRLLDIVAERFVAEHGIDFRDSPKSVGAVWRDCEAAKRTLTTRKKAAIACDHEGRSSRFEVTRDEFEHATADLLDRTRFTTTHTLKAAGLEWSDIDCVLLVGGSTRMPMVKAMIQELTGREPNTTISPDEAVAHGAALHAGFLIAKSEGRPTSFSIKNVNSHSLGVVGVDPSTRRPRTGIVIPRNTPLPVRAKRTFRTQKDGQQSILVRIVEGESPSPDACSPLGRCSVRDLPANLPAKTEVDVYFQYAANGRLTVRVVVPSHQCEAATEITRENSMSPTDLDAWKQRIVSVE